MFKTAIILLNERLHAQTSRTMPQAHQETWILMKEIEKKKRNLNFRGLRYSFQFLVSRLINIKHNHFFIIVNVIYNFKLENKKPKRTLFEVENCTSKSWKVIHSKSPDIIHFHVD